MNRSSIISYTWDIYVNATDDVKASMLSEMNLGTALHDLTWRGQCDVLQDAPVDVQLKYLGILAYESQVWMYRNALPVGAREQAVPLLSERAKETLRLKPKYRCMA